MKVAAIEPWIKPSLQPSNVKLPQGGRAPLHTFTRMQALFERSRLIPARRATSLVQGCESNQTSADDPTGTFIAAVATGDVATGVGRLTSAVHDKAGVGHERELMDGLPLNLLDLIAAVKLRGKEGGA